MKVVILASGYRTRLAGYISTIPKTMVEIGGEPILTYINIYIKNEIQKNFSIVL